jgi:hypothetical protein
MVYVGVMNGLRFGYFRSGIGELVGFASEGTGAYKHLSSRMSVGVGGAGPQNGI